MASGARLFPEEQISLTVETYSSTTDAVVASGANPRRDIMDRDRGNGLEARELTEAELDLVSGGMQIAKLVDEISPPCPPSGPMPLPYPNSSLNVR